MKTYDIKEVDRYTIFINKCLEGINNKEIKKYNKDSMDEDLYIDLCFKLNKFNDITNIDILKLFIINLSIDEVLEISNKNDIYDYMKGRYNRLIKAVESSINNINKIKYIKDRIDV